MSLSKYGNTDKTDIFEQKNVKKEYASSIFYVSLFLSYFSPLSPILCSSLGSTQLLQQLLVSFIHREHTAVDRNKEDIRIK